MDARKYHVSGVQPLDTIWAKTIYSQALSAAEESTPVTRPGLRPFDFAQGDIAGHTSYTYRDWRYSLMRSLAILT